VSAENSNNFALVLRPPSEIEKAEPGAKRVLSGMVADTLALIPDRFRSKTYDWLEKGNTHWRSKNHAEAFRCFRKGAEQGNAKAQELVGVFLLLGLGTARDEKEALNWFSKSVRRGNTGAACFVGEWFIERDYPEAYKWLTLAIEQGDERAAAGLKTLESWMSPQDLLEGKHRVRQFHAQP
jgi:TPR repeat protein